LRKTYVEEQFQEAVQDEETHEELAVIDRAGRIQIPRDYLESIKLGDSNKLRVELEDGRIVLVNPKSG